MTNQELNVLKTFIISATLLAALSLSAQTASRPSGRKSPSSQAVRIRPSPKKSAGNAADSATPIFLLFPVGYYDPQNIPAAIVVGDVNGDGKPDLVVIGEKNAYGGGGLASVLLGNGDSTFQAAVAYDSGGDGAHSGAIVDVNGDGKADLLVSNCSVPPNYNCGGHGSVGVLLGNGDGTFQSATPYDSGQSGFWPSIAAADVNGDAKPDVLVGGQVGTMYALLGNNDGTFRAPVAYQTASPVGSIVLADVNGDSKPDAIVVGGTSAGVLLGNGDGTFQSVVAYDSGGNSPRNLAVRDVNGDSKPDMAIANTNSGTVGVLLGNGNGTFQPVVTFNALGDGPSGGPFTVEASDVNNDGHPDLIMGTDGVSLLLGHGDGTFGSVDFFDKGQGVSFVTIADLSGDARPDLAVVNYYGVAVLLNNNGAPATTTTLAASVNPVTVKQPVTYTATVARQQGGSLTGSVEFLDGDYIAGWAPLAGNQAKYSPSYTYIGSRTIKAVYSGELNNAAGSNSNTLTEVVRGTSKTAVTTSGSPVMVGQAVTFTAKVTSKYGAAQNGEMVAFADGPTVLASVALSGGKAMYTTSALSGGTHSIKATYAGDATLAPSTGSIRQIVNKYSSTTTVSSSQNPSHTGQAVTFTAHVTSTGPAPTGKVQFLDGTTGIGSATLSGGLAKLTKSHLAVGTHPITAHYLGDAASAKSTSSVLNQVVQ